MCRKVVGFSTQSSLLTGRAKYLVPRASAAEPMPRGNHLVPRVSAEAANPVVIVFLFVVYSGRQ
jgi:hypothetical protein